MIIPTNRFLGTYGEHTVITKVADQKVVTVNTEFFGMPKDANDKQRVPNTAYYTQF